MNFSPVHYINYFPRLIKGRVEPLQLIGYIELYFQNRLRSELRTLLLQLEEWSVHPCYLFPHLPEVLVHLQLLCTLLSEHLESEESSLFIPLKQGKKENGNEEIIKQQIRLMEYEHHLIKEAFVKIRKICGQYHLTIEDPVLPGLYAGLQRCEDLFLEQEYLESQLLFKGLLQDHC